MSTKTVTDTPGCKGACAQCRSQARQGEAPATGASLPRRAGTTHGAAVQLIAAGPLRR